MLHVADVKFSEPVTNGRTMEFRPLNKRWFMLAIFILFTFVNSLQWGQYIIISNAVMHYYNVTGEQVDNTMVIYMIAYIPLIFPALWLLDKMGTRFCLVLGCAGLCAGAWIKVYGSMAHDRYSWVMIGQSMEAVFQVLAFGLAAKVAAMWFGGHEVSLACSLAVFGDQLGSAFGFLLPSAIVKDVKSNNSDYNINNSEYNEDLQRIRYNLTLLNTFIAVVTTFILISAFFFFHSKPKIPPSAAQAIQQETANNANILMNIKEALRGKSFILMMIAYGINVAAFNAYAALFNSGFTYHFGVTNEDHVGYIGFSIMIAGIFGSVIIGYLFDRTHLFKELTLLAYVCSFLVMFANVFALKFSNLVIVYISNILIGFFMVGYYSIGIQMAIELKFPLSEGFLASLLLLVSHILGIPFTKIYRYVYETSGDYEANMLLSISLFIGVCITLLIPSKLRRQGAEKSVQNQVV